MLEDSKYNDETNGEYEYPMDKKMFWIADWANRISLFIVIVAILKSLFNIVSYFSYQFPGSQWSGENIFGLIILPIINEIYALLYAGFLYFILQAITEIVYLLMDIREFINPEPVTKEKAP